MQTDPTRGEVIITADDVKICEEAGDLILANPNKYASQCAALGIVDPTFSDGIRLLAAALARTHRPAPADDEGVVEECAKAIAPIIMWEFDGWRLDKPVEWRFVGEKDRAVLGQIVRTVLALRTPTQAVQRALDAAAKVCQDRAEEWGKRWIAANQGKRPHERDYQNGRLAGFSDGAATVAKEILALDARAIAEDRTP